MSNVEFACVNEGQLVGKIISKPEVQKAKNGKEFVRFTLETFRYVIMPGNRREKLVRHHNVVVRKAALVPLFATHAPVGTIVRIVGEICYDPKPEIVVWEDYGTAAFMALVATELPGAAAAAPASAATTPAVSHQASGGPVRMVVGKKAADNSIPSIDDDNDDSDSDEGPSASAAIFSHPKFEGSNSFADEIPF